MYRSRFLTIQPLVLIALFDEHTSLAAVLSCCLTLCIGTGVNSLVIIIDCVSVDSTIIRLDIVAAKTDLF